MGGWVEIISFVYPHKAHLAKAFLESLGIDVILKDEFTVQVYNFYSNAIGGVKLFVESDKEDDALLLLQDGGYIEINKTDEKVQIKVFSKEYKTLCPYCESMNIARKNLPGYIFVLSILLLGFPIPFLNRLYHCYDCSKEWKIRSTCYFKSNRKSEAR